MLTIIQYITLFSISLFGAFIGIAKLTEPLFIFWCGVITSVLVIIVNNIFENIKS